MKHTQYHRQQLHCRSDWASQPGNERYAGPHKTSKRNAEVHRANPLLWGFDPLQFVLLVLWKIKSTELEQTLLTLPMSHMEWLVYYLIVLLWKGAGIEMCSTMSVFLIKVYWNQVHCQIGFLQNLPYQTSWVHTLTIHFCTNRHWFMLDIIMFTSNSKSTLESKSADSPHIPV